MIKHSVKRPLTILVVVIIILVLGYVSFTKMSTDLLPSFNLPYIAIITQYVGASPEQVESEVTKPIEEEMASLSNLKHITSSSNENYSMVTLEFEQTADLDSIAIDVSADLNSLSGSLPDGAGSPVMIKMNPNMLPVLVSAVRYEGKDYAELSDFAHNNILTKLESAEGVAQVTEIGSMETTLDVTISQEKIDEINRLMLESIDSDLAEAEKKLEEAQEKIDSGREKLESTYSENSTKISEGKAAVAEGQNLIDSKQQEIADAQSQIDAARKDLDEKSAALEEGLSGVADMIDSITIQMAIEEDPVKLQKLQAMLDSANEQKTALEEQKAQLDAGMAQIDEQQKQLDAGKAEISAGQSELDSQKAVLEQSEAALSSGIEKGSAQLDTAQETLDENRDVFNDAKEEALEKASIDGVVTVDLVSQMLAAQNFEMPAGYVDDNGIDTIVKIGEKIQDKEELENLVLFNLGLEYVDEVRVSDVADVEYSDNSDEIYAKLNSDQGVLYMFTAQSSYSTSEVGDNIKAVMAELEETYPGLEFVHMMDQGIYIDIVIETVMSNLILGAIFAVIVLFLFLRSPKPTLTVAVSIPISVVFALVLMYFSGMTMNIISLAGLALGIGMLVDNSIVVIENIYRLRALGVPARKAAYEGAKEMAPAIAASTLTTVSVFFPIVFTEGLTRQMFSDMALTITYSLLASLIVALTVVPAMSGSLLVNMKHVSFGVSAGTKFQSGYEKVIKWALKFKAVVIIALVAAFALSFYFAYMNGIVLLPDMEGYQMTGTVTMPHDMVAGEQYENVDSITQRIMEIKEVDSVGVMLSGSSTTSSFMTGSGGDDEYTLYINLKEDEKERRNSEIVKDVEEICSDYDCEYDIQSSNFDISQLTGSSGVAFKVEGENYDDMIAAAEDIGNIMEGVEGIKKVDNGVGKTDNEVRIVVDKDKAVKEGLTTAQVYLDVASQISDGTTATTLYEGETGTPVVVIDGNSYLIDSANIGDIHIAKPESSADSDSSVSFADGDDDAEEDDNEGNEKEEEKDYVLLSDIADISIGESPNTISHSDQKRMITVEGEVADGYNVTQTTERAQEAISGYTAPDGITIVNAGETESIFTAIKDLAYVLIIAIVLIYLIMVIQFQSLKSPFIVMFTIPLAFTGGFLALIIGGFELSTIVLVGMLLLAGVVVNNGIVLVDCINRFRLQGMEKKTAIIEACKTRMRPIFMTAVTTILGMLTLTMGMGMGAELIQPMAACVVGGLAYATILTLIFVPVLYDIFNRKELKRVEIEDFDMETVKDEN